MFTRSPLYNQVHWLLNQSCLGGGQVVLGLKVAKLICYSLDSFSFQHHFNYVSWMTRFDKNWRFGKLFMSLILMSVLHLLNGVAIYGVFLITCFLFGDKYPFFSFFNRPPQFAGLCQHLSIYSWKIFPFEILTMKSFLTNAL